MIIYVIVLTDLAFVLGVDATCRWHVASTTNCDNIFLSEKDKQPEK